MTTRQPKGIPVGGQFAESQHDEAESSLVLDMADAPTDGTVVELLFEGEWIPAYWSDEAYDGSPYGTTGWAQEDGGYHIVDVEGWRYPEHERIIDRLAEREQFALEQEECRLLDEKQRRREERAASAERTKRRREHLEERYQHYTGEPAPKMTMRELRASVGKFERENRAKEIGEIMSSFFRFR